MTLCPPTPGTAQYIVFVVVNFVVVFKVPMTPLFRCAVFYVISILSLLISLIPNSSNF